MRAAARLLASVKPGQFLEAGAPTGLTGLTTHPSPRSTLLYHYNATLDKLKKIPESSVYRQSTEALTRHRLQIVEQSKPKGWDEWQDKIRSQIAKVPDQVSVIETGNGQTLVLPTEQEVDERTKGAEWDGRVAQSMPEGIYTAQERLRHRQKMKAPNNGPVNFKPDGAVEHVKFEPEPQYTVEAYVWSNRRYMTAY
tara:strand:+ start:7968 stop:8555 length:588 start_codon:yes stop_codon:yes gene_type:complete